MSNKNIEVPDYVLTAFEEVRESGKTNMFDCNTVLCYMFEFNHYEAVSWLGELNEDKVICNKEKYSAILTTISDNYKVLNALS